MASWWNGMMNQPDVAAVSAAVLRLRGSDPGLESQHRLPPLRRRIYVAGLGSRFTVSPMTY